MERNQTKELASLVQVVKKVAINGLSENTSAASLDWASAGADYTLRSRDNAYGVHTSMGILKNCPLKVECSCNCWMTNASE